MQATALVLICSLSKSARFRTSRRSTLCKLMYLNNSSGDAVPDTGSIGFPFEGLRGIEFDRPDGLRGIVGFVGDPGRLENVSAMGVIGVLEGLSIGTVKFLNEAAADADISPLRKPFVSDPDFPLVGTEGRENAGLSSNSSIEGKA
jgi:hypothetical protein